MTISAVQLRIARAALAWGVRKLAAKAGLSPDTISRAELASTELTSKTLGALQRAFEEAGIEFLSETNSVTMHDDVTRAAVLADPGMPLGVRRVYLRRRNMPDIAGMRAVARRAARRPLLDPRSVREICNEGWGL